VGTAGDLANEEGNVRKKIAVPVVLIIWLIIGLIAAAQRGYLSTDHDCGSFGSTVVTILVGPLNYIGVNPQVECPSLPQPSE
jgi:hypothetical protein